MNVSVEPPVRQRGVCCQVAMPLDAGAAARTVAVLKALADPTRLQMVATLRASDQPVCVCDFTAAFGLSQPTISHHMGKLRAAGVVDSEKRGIWMYYRLRPDLPASVTRLIDAALPSPPTPLPTSPR